MTPAFLGVAYGLLWCGQVKGRALHVQEEKAQEGRYPRRGYA